MSKYLDFENEKYEKGFRQFPHTRDNFKQNIGKRICYVTTWDVDKHRGTFFVRHGVIHSVKYNQLHLDDHHGKVIDIRNILDCGIEIEKNQK